MAPELDPQDTEHTEVDTAEEERRRRRSPWAWIALIILILAIIWLLWQYFGTSTGDRRGLSGPVTTTSEIAVPPATPAEPPAPPATPAEAPQPVVPDVVGMTKGAAIAAIRAAGYTPLVTELYGTAHPANTVFRQIPSAGSMLEEGGSVAIQVQQLRSTVPMYAMPKLRGLTKADALRRLAALGITPDISYSPVIASGKLGTIASQWPEAGQSVERGGDVQIQVFVNP